MKTCNVLSALLFGSIAAAVPLRQRDLVTKYETVVETIVVYTTVFDEAPVAEATSSPGLFFEKPSTTEVQPSSTATPTPTPTPEQPKEQPKVEEPSSSSSSVYTPPPPAPTTTEAPKVETPSSVYVAPAAPSSAAPVSSAAPAAPVAPIKAAGNSHSGDITVYDNTGAAGACGKPLTDGDFIAAIGKGAWGVSTYDQQTGESTNPWCGKKITVEYNGNTVDAIIMDMCPGCAGDYDIDLSVAAWNKLTGSTEKTRYQATWTES